MFVDKLDAVVKKINKINEVLLVISIILMFIVLLAQIFTRFIFFIPLPASQDLLVFFLVASVFLGAGIAVAKNKHIALEFLVELLPKKIGDKTLVFADFVSMVFLCIVFYQSIILIGKTKGALIGASPIPVSGYYVIVAIGSIMMMINYFNHFMKKLFNSENREEK